MVGNNKEKTIKIFNIYVLLGFYPSLRISMALSRYLNIT